MPLSDYAMWFIAGAILVVAEIFMPGMVIIWFGFGALMAGLAALIGAGTIIQIITFIIFSVVSLVVAQKYLKKKEKGGRKVGAERLIGKKGKVVVKIEPGEFGRISIEGEKWLAGADDVIPEGSWIIVEDLDGAHLIVKKVSDDKET